MAERVGGVVLDNVAVAEAAFAFSKGTLAVSLFGSNGVTTDAQWSTLIDTLFTTGSVPDRWEFIRSFFNSLVTIKPAIGPGSDK